MSVLDSLVRLRDSRVTHNDVTVLHSSVDYDRQANHLRYLLFDMVVTHGPDDVEHFYKAIRLYRLIRVPKNKHIATFLMEKQAEVLASLWEQQIHFLSLIANILRPDPIGLVYSYGVQGVGSTLEEAKQDADRAFATLTASLKGVFRTIQFRQYDYREAEWLRRRMNGMDHLAMLKGIPYPHQGTSPASMNQGQTNGDMDLLRSQTETMEEFIAGMTDYEYVMLTMANPIQPKILQRWLTALSKEETKWASIAQGTANVNFSVSLPMMFGGMMGGNQGFNTGTSHTTGHADGTSTSWADGTAFGVNHGVSHTHTDGSNTGWNQGVGTNQGISHTMGASTNHSAGTSQSQGVSSATTHGTSSGTGTSHTTSQGTSHTASNGSTHTVGSSQTVTNGTTHTVGTSQTVTNGTTHTVGSSTTHTTGSSQSSGSSTTNSSGSSSTTGSSQSQGTGSSSMNGGSQTSSTGHTHQSGTSSGWSKTSMQSTGHAKGTTDTTSQTNGTTSTTSKGVADSKGTSLTNTSGIAHSKGTSDTKSSGTSSMQTQGSSWQNSASDAKGHTTSDTKGSSSSQTFSKQTSTGTSQQTSQNVMHGHSKNFTRSTNISGEPLGFGLSHTGGRGSSDTSSVTSGVSSGTTSSTAHGSSTMKGDQQSQTTGNSNTQSSGHSYGGTSGSSSGSTKSQSTGTTASTTDSSSVSKGTTSSQTLSNTTSLAHSATKGLSTAHSQTTTVTDGTSKGLTGGTTSSNGTTNSQSTGQTWSDGTTSSNSYGTTSTQGSTQSTSLGTTQTSGTSVSDSTGTSVSDSTSHSVSNGTSVSDATSHSVANGTSVSNGTSQSTSNGTSSSVSNGTSTNNGISDSQSTGTSASTGSTATSGTGTSTADGTTAGTSSSHGWSGGNSISNANGTTSGTSFTRSRSEGGGTSSTNSVSNGTTAGNSLGWNFAQTSTLGMAPGISMGKSYQWKDVEVDNVLRLFDFQRERLLRALNGQGAFYVDVMIATDNDVAHNAAQGIAKAAFYNKEAWASPLQILEPQAAKKDHLLYHFSSFSPCTEVENQYALMDKYKYSTALLADELTAYTHPPRISDGGLYADVDDMPSLSVPSDRQFGDIYMGRILSAQRWSEEMYRLAGTGHMTPFRYTIYSDQLMHALFQGQSRSGKTVSAIRFVVGLSKIRRPQTDKRVRIIVFDQKDDWRKLANLVDPDRFRFYKIDNIDELSLRLNLCKIPPNVHPETHIKTLAEIFVSAYGLGILGIQIMKDALYDVYNDAGCLGEDWKSVASERSSRVTMSSVYDRVFQERQENGKGMNMKDAYDRVLMRLKDFAKPGSILHEIFATTNGIGIHELLGADDVVVIEAKGLDRVEKNFVYGMMFATIYGFGVNNGTFLADDQYETVLVVEEANAVLIGQSSDGSDNGDNLPGQSRFEDIVDQAAGNGLFVVSITQKMHQMPSSIVNSCGILFVGRTDTKEVHDVVMASFGKNQRMEYEIAKWMPMMPTGWFMVKTSRTSDYKDSQPVHVAVDMIPAEKPTDQALVAMKKERRYTMTLNSIQ